MAYGTKTIKFNSGEKVKVANVVLEAIKSGIIRDYIKATKNENVTCNGNERIKVFFPRTYLRWLQVE